jgi:hypothetical protein
MDYTNEISYMTSVIHKCIYVCFIILVLKTLMLLPITYHKMYDNRRLNGMHFRQRTALTVNCEWQTLQDIKSLCIEKECP